jgi:thiol-disulfide isomerase/thioredoxin
MNPCSYTHLIFDNGIQNTWWRKDSLFNKWFWEKWISACRKLKLDPCLSLCTNINSKWIRDLNIRPETLKLVQERAGNTLKLAGIDSDFLNKGQMAHQLRHDWRMGLHETKKLLHNKRNGHQIEEAVHRMGENLCQLYIWQRFVIIYRELKKLNSQNINDPIKKWANEPNGAFSKEEVQMAEKHMAIKQMQIKTTLRLLYLLLYSGHIKHFQFLGFLPFPIPPV